MKGLISLLKKLCIRIIIYLDDMDMLLIGKRIFNSRRYINILVAASGVSYQLQKSTLNPTSIFDFLGVLLNSKTMTLSLPTEKARKIQEKCREVLSQ